MWFIAVKLDLKELLSKIRLEQGSSGLVKESDIRLKFAGIQHNEARPNIYLKLF